MAGHNITHVIFEGGMETELLPPSSSLQAVLESSRNFAYKNSAGQQCIPGEHSARESE
jgi:hypothetical protein